MFDEVIVPLDGSKASARALRPASAVARYLDLPMRVVAFHPPSESGDELTRTVCDQVDTIGVIERVIQVEPTNGPVEEALIALLSDHLNAFVVMSTHGYGRSATLLGSVANELLAQTGAPVLLIGPRCDISRFRLHGPMIIAADGSDYSQAVLDMAADITNMFDFEPSVVNVLDPSTTQRLDRARAGSGDQDVPHDSMLAHRYAVDLASSLGRSDVDYRVLHNRDPAKAIVKRALDADATLVAMATHARSGLKRLALGSVTSDVIGQAPCPVLAVSPA